MSALNLDALEGSTTFNLAEILNVFQQIDTILSGASSSFGFTARGDGGTNQSITNGNTLYIKGGNGIGTVGEATDTVRAFIKLSTLPGNSLTFDNSGALYGTDTASSGGGGETIVTYSPKYTISRPGHGLGSAGQIKLLSADFTLANAASLTTTADYVALIIDTNSLYLLADGFHQIIGHGLNIGVWYALSTTTAGSYELSYNINADKLRQNAFIAVDANTILVSLQEADPARVIPEATKVPQSGHGFAVGDIVTHDGTNYVDGAAGEFAHFVKEVIDADNFILSRTWSGSKSGLVAGKTYALNPGSPGAIVDLSTLDPSIDPITVVGFCSKANYLLGFTEYPLICCGDTGGGGGGGGGETLLWSESYEGGAHQNSYSDSFGFGSANLSFINSTARATDGDYFIRYTASSGTSDFLTYYANDAISPAKTHLKMVGDFCLINLIQQSVNPIFHFMEESGGSQAGYRVSLVYSSASGGFYLRRSQYPSGAFDTSDFPSSHTVVAGKWYRLTFEAKISSAPNTADGEIKWKVEELQGDEASGTDGTVVATLIPERVISAINTHPTPLTISGFNHVKGSGGYIAELGTPTGNWGVAYDNIKVFEVTP